MSRRENHSMGAEARRAVPSHHWRPGEEGRQDLLLRYLGAVATVSAKHAGARSVMHPATTGTASPTGPGPAPSPSPKAERETVDSAGEKPPQPLAEPEALSVRDVMDVPAPSMRDDLSYREIARLLAREHVGAVPVVDADDRVVGVVSESDLLAKVALEASGRPSGPLSRLRELQLHGKVRAETAADLMTSPAITVLPGATVAEAAWLAALSRLKRIPVTDHEGRLVGVVRRNALLQALIRDDAGIRQEIDAKMRAFCSPSDRDTVEVRVHDGVVEFTGRMSQASMPRLLAEVEDIDDVVEVTNHLTAV
ncbi:CBS domain-containing protein [Streptomyces chiangmaiensis]|uniref:CBS domain-containing protein n=1 Tax=Streptomyces chiangmaiensis TaxID=766497 RepID=A0ABU7FWY5_9ACTN|nr:CBS domain-containing protein [Streptomyces chiangmaiensis]MED7828063.1 CBS domain-containing protein [Streptomyces chiangmaiensis]